MLIRPTVGAHEAVFRVQREKDTVQDEPGSHQKQVVQLEGVIIRIGGSGYETGIALRKDVAFPGLLKRNRKCSTA